MLNLRMAPKYGTSVGELRRLDVCISDQPATEFVCVNWLRPATTRRDFRTECRNGTHIGTISYTERDKIPSRRTHAVGYAVRTIGFGESNLHNVPPISDLSEPGINEARQHPRRRLAIGSNVACRMPRIRHDIRISQDRS